MNFLRDILGLRSSDVSVQPANLPTLEPIRRRVLAVIHNPVFRSRGGQKASRVFNWNDPDRLAQEYIEDIRWCSDGYANYEIAERIEVDGFPIKRDGFVYNEASFMDSWQTKRFHEPDAVDYLRLVRQFSMIQKIDSGAIDEVWLLGFPYCGYYESIMAGPRAFWCNAPPLEGTEYCSRRFVIMGFNYERGVGEMLEDLGHRAEAILTQVFKSTRGEANLFERFTRYELKNPGRAEVGNIHFAPNSLRDYDWGNPRPVLSRCDTWYNFPDLSGEARRVTCSEWGSGDIRAHHRWWLRHLPHVGGEMNGIANNWWQYIIDPNRAP